MADIKLFIRLDEESYQETLKQIQELNRQGYVITKLLKRSWLLRLIFGVNLKKLKLEVTYK